MDSFGPAQGSLSSGLTAAAYPLLAPNGTAAAPSYSFSGDTDTGMFAPAGGGNLAFATDGTAKVVISGVDVRVRSTGRLGFSSGAPESTALDTFVERSSAGVLSLLNGTTAQEFRVYGTTTGSQYISIKNDGGGVSSVLGVGSGGALRLGATGAAAWQIAGTATFRLTSLGNYAFAHGTSALATDATEGYLFIQSCNGTPTGVPASIPTGQIALVYDTANNKFYVYNGGWKRGQVAAVDVIWA